MKAIIFLSLMAVIFAAELVALGKPKPRVPYTCPRDVAGGELLSFKKDPVLGDEFDCHYVKRGVK